MIQTFRATVRGNHIEWKETPPDIAGTDYEVEVMVDFPDRSKQKGERPFGLAKGEFVVPKEFDAPLPHGILSDFEN